MPAITKSGNVLTKELTKPEQANSVSVEYIVNPTYLLDKIKQVDGKDSGLDADLVRGSYINPKMFKNRIINGDFAVWQRGKQFFLDGSGSPVSRYTADRMRCSVGVGNSISVKCKEVYSLNEGNTANIHDIFGDGSCIATYTFEGNANDLGGNYNGTWSGTEQYDTGVFGQAAKFDGNSHIDFGNYVTCNTISLWVNINDFGNYQSFFREKLTPTDININFRVDMRKLYLQGTKAYYSNSTLNFGQWYHIVLVRNSATSFSFYINGQIDNIVATESLGDNLYLLLGEIKENGSCKINGLIDQVRIFNRALTEDEIRKLYVEDLQYIEKRHAEIKIVTAGDPYSVTPYEYRFEGHHVYDLIGRKVTLSFDFASSKNQDFTIRLKYPDGTIFDEKTFSYSGDGQFERHQKTFDLSSFDKTKIFNNEMLGLILTIGEDDNLSSGDWIRLSDIQLEEGEVATEFEYVPFEIQLVRCMRYYEKSYDLNVVPGTATYNCCVGYRVPTVGANPITTSLEFKIPKRCIPTVTVWSPATGAEGYVRSTSVDYSASIDQLGAFGCRVSNNDSSNNKDNIWFHYEADAEL